MTVTCPHGCGWTGPAFLADAHDDACPTLAELLEQRLLERGRA